MSSFKDQIFRKLQDSQGFNMAPKGLKMMQKIIESTIDEVNKHGAYNLNLEKIAKACGVTRPLLSYYFASTSELIELTSEYIRISYQNYVLLRIANLMDPEQILLAYLKAAWTWKVDNPKEGHFWLVFFHQCSVSNKSAKLHQAWVEMGAQRIESILKLGQQTRQFDVKDPRKTARIIQILLTGGIASVLTEARSKNEAEEIYQQIESVILSMVNPAN